MNFHYFFKFQTCFILLQKILPANCCVPRSHTFAKSLLDQYRKLVTERLTESWRLKTTEKSFVLLWGFLVEMQCSFWCLVIEMNSFPSILIEVSFNINFCTRCPSCILRFQMTSLAYIMCSG
jgi:hypothetical protein